MERESKKRFPTNPKDYKLYEEVGEGVSATVYRALCVPLNVIVAIKVLDLEKCNSGLDAIRREAQTMSLIDHPNVLRAHCSFTADSSLWVVMPYMAGGSCLHIMKSAYPEGFEEPVIATLLWEVLKALVYLHGHGHIHRDVKAGNILMNANGAVKLADFGVSASVFDAGYRQRSRNTFVGTPCWMAPEVMQQLHGYDFKADIWSFGITALELAHGHAPFSKYPPMKVLLMTLQNAPPCLDYERDRKFSKSFKDMVATCLVKDPKKRPASEKLLKHPFFKHARSNEYLARTILDGLPPLGARFRSLKGKESDFLLKNKAMHGDKEELSQQRYIRGISGWNFNLDDLKAQAALLTASDDIPYLEDLYNHPKAKARQEDAVLLPMLSPERVEHENATSKEETLQDFQNLEGPFTNAFRSHPLLALKGCFDVCEDDIDAISPKWKDPIQSNVESMSPLQHLLKQDLKVRKIDGQNLEKRYSVPQNINFYGQPKFSSGSLIPECVLASSSSTLTGERVERDEVQQKHQHGRNISGPLYPQMKGFYNRTCAHVESLEGKVVQCKGRFKVTSTDSFPKVSPANCMANPVNWVPANATVNAGLVSPTLQFMLQQNTMQQEQLIKLMKILEQTSCHRTELSNVRNVEFMQHSLTSSREKELQAYLVHLRQRIGNISEELQQLNFENSKLEQQISALSVQKGKGRAPSKESEA